VEQRAAGYPLGGPRGPRPVKGDPNLVLNRVGAGRSDEPIDCRAANALHLHLFPAASGTTSVRVLGGPGEGGPWMELPNARARRTGIDAMAMLEVPVGCAFALVELFDTTGAWSVIATPFQSADRDWPPYRFAYDLLAATAIAADGTVNRDPVAGFGGHRALLLELTVAAKTMDVGTTLDVYVQTSPDDGTTWDDVAHFAQLTNAAVGNGTYLARVLNDTDAGFADRATTDGTLTANTTRDYFADKLRVKTIAAGFAGADTVTVRVQATGVG
jgi:hypothetical protein